MKSVIRDKKQASATFQEPSSSHRKGHLSRYPRPEDILWFVCVFCQLRGMPSLKHPGCGSPKQSGIALMSVIRIRGMCTDPEMQQTYWT